MRTYGRTYDAYGVPTWVEVTTDAQGFDDAVWLTTLIQTLKLNLNESPFFANFGIPSHDSVVQQVFPDFYMTFTQQQYAQYFASLIISKVAAREPVYNVAVVTQQGYRLNASVAIPT